MVILKSIYLFILLVRINHSGSVLATTDYAAVPAIPAKIMKANYIGIAVRYRSLVILNVNRQDRQIRFEQKVRIEQ